MPAPPPGHDPNFPDHPDADRPIDPPRKFPMLGVVIALVACLGAGGIAGWTLAPTDGPTVLELLHSRALAGCNPVTLSIRAVGVTPESARRTADAQIQGARAQGVTSGGYLVTGQDGAAVVTLYAEECG